MLLELQDVHFHYAEPGANKTALNGIDLTVNEGDFTALIGPSGSGKSTLLLHLNGLLRPAAGHVLYTGCDIHAKGYDLRRVRRNVGLLFQFAEANFFGQTVCEDVSYAPWNHGLRGRALDQAVIQALEMVGLPPSVKARSPFSLSGGEKRKVALAGVLAMEPRVLLLDEPTAGLDPGTRENFLYLLKDLNRQGIAIVIVSHDLDEVAAVARQAVVLKAGRVLAKGTVREVLTSPDMENWDLEPPEAVWLGKLLGLKHNGMPVLSEAEAVSSILARGK